MFLHKNICIICKWNPQQKNKHKRQENERAGAGAGMAILGLDGQRPCHIGHEDEEDCIEVLVGYFKFLFFVLIISIIKINYTPTYYLKNANLIYIKIWQVFYNKEIYSLN